VSFAATTLCVASQRVFIVVVSLFIQSGNFWIHPRMAVSVVSLLIGVTVCFVRCIAYTDVIQYSYRGRAEERTDTLLK